MKEKKFETLTIDEKRKILQALASGVITKTDLEDPTILELALSGGGTINLTSFDLFGKKEYKHKGINISKEEFDKLEAFYKKLNPEMDSSVNVIFTHPESPIPLAESEDSEVMYSGIIQQPKNSDKEYPLFYDEIKKEEKKKED